MSSVSSGHAHHVEHVAEHRVADGDRYPPAGVADRRTAHEAVGRLEADAPHPSLADLLRDLGDYGDLLAVERRGPSRRRS